MAWVKCLTPILMMPHSHLVPLSSKPFFDKVDPTPLSYAMVTRGLSSPSKCSSDPIFNIPEIEVRPPALRKRGSPLPVGCHILPMAPLAARLPWPTQMDHLPVIAMIINLTDKPSMMSEEPSLACIQPVQLESQMQVKMSGGTLVLQCRTGGRITSGAHNEERRKSR
jgi:hypothetical protein